MDKKVLVALLAGTMIAASASSLFAADIKFSGEYRVRGFLTDNADGSGDVNDTEAVTDMRFRMKTTATAGMATAVAVVDFLNAMGPVQGVNDAATLQTTSPAGSGYVRYGNTGFGGANNTVGIREAYMKAAWPDWTLAAGRKGTKLGHGIILDDTADTIAAMGKMGGITWGVANLKLFDPQARRLGLAGAAGADTDAYIFHVMGSPMPDNDGSVYIAGIIDRGGTTGGVTRPNITALQGGGATAANLWVIGGTWDGKLSPFNYQFELDILTGKRTAPSGVTVAAESISGLDILAGGGMDLGMGNVGLWLIYGSGQDPSSTSTLNINDISPNYMVGTFLSNNATNTDRDGGSIGNMFAIKLTGAMSPMDKLSTDAALIFASCARKTRPDGATAASNLTTAGANPLPRPAGTCATDTNLGTELDLNAAYTLADNLSLSGGLGLLFSGNGYKTAAAATSGNAGTQSQLWTTLAYNF